jgi:hypothetical protein
MAQHTEIGRTPANTITVSSTDPISYYYYTYDNSSRDYTVSSGHRGSGDSFSDTVGFDMAGKYCHITFYTEAGKSTSCTLKVPEIATLSYNANGGTGAPSGTTTVWAGDSTYVSSVVPSRDNFEFLGWSTSKLSDVAYGVAAPSGLYKGGSTITLYNDTTLYAVWREVKIPYGVSFTLNGQNVSNDYALITGYVNNSCRVSNGWAFSAKEIPGYSIRYTATPADSSSIYIISGASNSRTITYEVYDTVACGTIHTITYSANGGTYGTDEAGNELAGPEDQTRYYGRNLYLTSTVPTRVGYTFAGWKSNRTGITFSAGGLYGTGSTAYSSWMRGGTETMVAQWEVMS